MQSCFFGDANGNLVGDLITKRQIRRGSTLQIGFDQLTAVIGDMVPDSCIVDILGGGITVFTRWTLQDMNTTFIPTFRTLQR